MGKWSHLGSRVLRCWGVLPAGRTETYDGAGETSLSREASQAWGSILPGEAGGTRVPL